MFYQVRANLFFTEEDEAKDFFHDCELAFAKADTINPDSETSEFSIVELINNNHDVNPNEPCALVAILTTEPPPPL